MHSASLVEDLAPGPRATVTLEKPHIRKIAAYQAAYGIGKSAAIRMLIFRAPLPNDTPPPPSLPME